MSFVSWKPTILKQKEICNQIVQTVKRTNPQFSEEELSLHIVPFFDSITGKEIHSLEDEKVVLLFETLVALISKHILKQLGNSTSLFYQILADSNSEIKKDPILFISYLTNAITKLGTEKKEMFLTRFHSLLPKIQTMDETKFVLGLLYWASGNPEYREGLYPQIQTLRVELKTEIKNLFRIDASSLQFPFAPRTKKESSKMNFHFRSIPGYTLFGGYFHEIPVLYIDSEKLLVRSGENWFQLFVDEFGTSFYPIEKPLSPTLASVSPSAFWKPILEQKLDAKQVHSSFEKDSFVLFTLKQSYQVYLFYLGRT
ncbi:hypothetical protein AB3N60_13735 [Leptospira sp. WS39.C2]